MKKYSKKLADDYTRRSDEFEDANSRLFNFVKRVGVKDKHILDLGCGDGRYAAILLNMGANSVQGIDLSPTMIELAEERQRDIEFVVGDCAELPYENERFDIIFSRFVLHNCTDLEKVFLEIARTLKKGGYFMGSFNSVETENSDILNKEMPILLGKKNPITVYNLIKRDEEYQSAMKNAGLEVIEYGDESNSSASVDPGFKYYAEIKKLKTKAYLCRKS